MIISVLLFRSYRPTFWEVEDKEKLKERSLRRVRCLLGATPRDQVEAEVRVTTFPLFFCCQSPAGLTPRAAHGTRTVPG
jgi:hypothetical protein